MYIYKAKNLLQVFKNTFDRTKDFKFLKYFNELLISIMFCLQQSRINNKTRIFGIQI
jgi:hypothetical protein